MFASCICIIWGHPTIPNNFQYNEILEFRGNFLISPQPSETGIGRQKKTTGKFRAKLLVNLLVNQAKSKEFQGDFMGVEDKFRKIYGSKLWVVYHREKSEQGHLVIQMAKTVRAEYQACEFSIIEHTFYFQRLGGINPYFNSL